MKRSKDRTQRAEKQLNEKRLKIGKGLPRKA